MPDIKLSREERETQLLTNEATDSWDFWSCSDRWIRKVQKLGYPVQKDHQGGCSCKIPIDKIAIRGAHARKRQISQASLAALAKGRKGPKSPDTDRQPREKEATVIVGQGGREGEAR
jgi:hypothetical protein